MTKSFSFFFKTGVTSASFSWSGGFDFAIVYHLCLFTHVLEAFLIVCFMKPNANVFLIFIYFNILLSYANLFTQDLIFSLSSFSRLTTLKDQIDKPNAYQILGKNSYRSWSLLSLKFQYVLNHSFFKVCVLV